MSTSTGPRRGLLINALTGDNFDVTFRAFLRAIDALLSAAVINLTTSAPPGSPANGDAYIVKASGTGAWTGHDNALAIWTTDNPATPGGLWEFYPAASGMIVVNLADSLLYYWKSSASAWTAIGLGAVTSVAGRTGAVVLGESDITSLTTDLAAKATASALSAEVSRAEAAEALLAPLASPALTGNPTAPTQTAHDNSTRIATTAYTDGAVAAGIGGIGGGSSTLAGDTDVSISSPANNDVLTYETSSTKWKNKPAGGAVTSVAGRTGAVVLGESDITSLTTDLAAKATLASPALTGNPTAPTQTALDNSTKIATTAYTDGAVAAAAGGGGLPAGTLITVGVRGTGSGGAGWNNYTLITAILGEQVINPVSKVQARICVIGGAGMHLQGFIISTNRGSTTVVSKTAITWAGGNSSYVATFSGASATNPFYLDSDAITVTIDKEHDWYVYIYLDTDGGGYNAGVVPWGSSTTNLALCMLFTHGAGNTIPNVGGTVATGFSTTNPFVVALLSA